MSDTPLDADALQQYLAGTEVGPSELRDLLVRHYADLEAVDVLCDHAEEPVSLQVAVFAAWEHFWCVRASEVGLQAGCDFGQSLDSWCQAQFQGVTGTELREFLRTARAVFPDEHEGLFSTIALWLMKTVPLRVLTDEVVAEMSIWDVPSPSPALGVGQSPGSDDLEDVGCWLMSRYLYSRFGEDDLSWYVFVKLYNPERMSIGEAVDQVAHLHTLFGAHGPSWDLFITSYDPRWVTVGDLANQVAHLHTLFGTHGPSWDVLLKLHDPQRFSLSDVANQVAHLHTLFGTHGPSWDVLLKLFDPKTSQISDIANQVAMLHTQLGTRGQKWAMFMDLHNSLKETADIDAIAKLAATLGPPSS